MKVLSLVVLLFMMSCAQTTKKSEVETGNFKYKVEGVNHTGYVKSGAKKGEKAPGVIVVHEWWGHNDYARSRVDALAKLGYVALSIDMYGEGAQADHPQDAGAFAKKAMSDFGLAKKRFTKALEILKARSDVDTTKISAIGYCFGGGVVLNMARSGVKMDLVASFHGAIKGQTKFDKKTFNGKVLVFNGAKDPMVTKEDIENFKREVESSKIDYKFVNYKDAVHAFSNKDADMLGKKFKLPLAYDKKADEDSWNQFLAELKKL